jgi:hypothetical protein
LNITHKSYTLKIESLINPEIQLSFVCIYIFHFIVNNLTVVI